MLSIGRSATRRNRNAKTQFMVCLRAIAEETLALVIEELMEFMELFSSPA
jgi:hypothetical protein